MWQPHPGPQTWVLERKEKEVLFGGARGGGKTEAGLAWLCEPEYISNPRYRALVIRRNYDDLSDWIHRAKIFYRDIAEIVGKPAEIRWRAGGITRLGHWNDREALGKYLGHEYQKMLIEELTEGIGSELEYLQLLGSCRSSLAELPSQIFATTNPGNRGHVWVKKHWVDVAFKKTYVDPETGYTRIYVPSTIDNNPTLLETDPGYVKFLEGLPEPLKSAWRFGSWDGFEGQFFVEFGKHLAEKPFEIASALLHGRFFGSLDSGTTHATSFGLWYFDNDFVLHRLMTYMGTGMTIRGHAEEIFNRIESFPFTGGYFPEVIAADPSMWTKVKLNQNIVRSPIDEYIELFREKGRQTVFEPANNDRYNGCQIMRMLFKGSPITPVFRYWDKFNASFEEAIFAAITDKNNVEVYKKIDGDDVVDESRYGIVKGNSLIGTFRQRKNEIEPKTHLQRLLAGDFHQSHNREDWYNT